MEASLRRITHYDFKDNALRRSILFDAKADIIVYGMGEKSILELAQCIQTGKEWKNIKGICYISKEKNEPARELPSFEECVKNKDKFFEAFNVFYKNMCSQNEEVLLQKHTDRYLVHNPRQPALSMKELDEIYDLDYTRETHPYYAKLGEINAQNTIKFSITTHRGCFGECNFCSIVAHQGREVVSRSETSIVNEAIKITQLKDFKGYITDMGGPSANMFDAKCSINTNAGKCKNKRCMFPSICEKLIPGHNKQIELIKKVTALVKVKKVFISSGIRYDIICADIKHGQNYLDYITENNTSGQMKVAPEHCDDKILSLMGKPTSKILKQFIEMFNKSKNKKQFLTYYFIAAYPGCDVNDMKNLQYFIGKNLQIHPEQVQIFTPTPSTNATLMYYTEKNLSGTKIFIEKDRNRKQKQKSVICR
jgi:uncharacterized radical SAM protein YgiQ